MRRWLGFEDAGVPGAVLLEERPAQLPVEMGAFDPAGPAAQELAGCNRRVHNRIHP